MSKTWRNIYSYRKEKEEDYLWGIRRLYCTPEDYVPSSALFWGLEKEYQERTKQSNYYKNELLHIIKGSPINFSNWKPYEGKFWKRLNTRRWRHKSKRLIKAEKFEQLTNRRAKSYW